jgi:hypothetical protein
MGSVKGEGKRRDCRSVSIPRRGGKAMEEHRRGHEDEHVGIMNWMNKEAFVVPEQVGF